MPKKIGIVEDEGIVAMDLSNILAVLGYKTAFITDTGEKALLKIEETSPDAVLMDIELKGKLNGLQTALKIKELHSLPVIFLTAFEDESTIEKILSVSSEGFIVKPFEDELLKSVLQKLFS